MAITFFILFAIYSILVGTLILGWTKSIEPKLAPSSINIENFISVIVPARNEEACITNIVNDLMAQNYPFFEVIILDDHSEDRTREKATLAIAFDRRFTILQSTLPGKKAALSYGIENARGEIIVTTDADCRVGKNWLRLINNHFQNEKIKLAFGAVKIIRSNSLGPSMQAIEFGSLVGSGAATLYYGLPTMCNGANLAFRKNIFEQVGGYRDNIHIPSGDDEFLLRKVLKKYPDSVQFMNEQGAIVSTAPQVSVKSFINQRIRWAGKWSYHQSIRGKILSLFIFFIHVATLLCIGVAFGGMISLKQLLFVYSFKILLEFIFLYKVSFFFQNQWNWRAFILLELFYPLYVVFIGILSNFRSFQWKGRKLRSNQADTDSGK